MKNTTTNTTTPRTLMRAGILVSLSALAACGGGGGGGGGGLNHTTSLGALSNTGQLAAIESGNAAMALCTSIEPNGFGAAGALTMDPRGDRFYAFDSSGTLLAIEGNGAARAIGQPTVRPTAIAFDTGANVIYGVRNVSGSAGTLVRIDPNTAETTTVGSCDDARCIAFDAAGGVLYAVGSNTTLSSIDVATGASTTLFTDPELGRIFGLAFDPVTRTLYGADNQDPASIWSIDLMSRAVVRGLSFEPDPRRTDLRRRQRTPVLPRLGRARRAGAGRSDGPRATPRANLGRRLAAMAFDPAEEAYFAVDTIRRQLVKVAPETNVIRTVGSLGAHDVSTLAYDPVARRLTGIDGGTRRLLDIDPMTAAVTELAYTFLYPAVLTADPATGTIYAFEKQRALSLLVDPLAPSASILMTAVLGIDITLTDISYVPSLDRCVGSGFRRVSLGGGSFEFRDGVYSFDPRARTPRTLAERTPYRGEAIGRDQRDGSYHLYQRGQPLFQLTTNAGATSVTSARTVNGVWKQTYETALHVPSLGVVFATDSDELFELDPVTGSTRLLGRQPGGVRADDLVFDEVTGWLGLRDDDVVRWVDPRTPFSQKGTLVFLAPDQRVVAEDTRFPGLYYGAKDGVLWLIDSRISPPAIARLNPVAHPGVTELHATIRPGEDAMHVTTTDRRLFRVDLTTFEWTEVGNLTYEVLGLYAN